ncbi:hypothetical protein [Streptomyces qinglanensis]|uniref:hypothetical protein n=1 Tax=Streptomyces qinglanensis TaxID=943816 RepID=UPI003D756256
MSYRNGVYVVDRRTNRVGKVMDTHGTYMQLRPPRGGTEWDCPPAAARLATQAECHDAGITANGTPRALRHGTRS